MSERIELVLDPDIIVGETYIIITPQAVKFGSRAGKDLFVDLSERPNVMAALIRDFDFILAGGTIVFPSARHHVCGKTKIEIRTRPGAAVHLSFSRVGQKATLTLDEAELRRLREAVNFIYRRTKHAQAATVIRRSF